MAPKLTKNRGANFLCFIPFCEEISSENLKYLVQGCRIVYFQTKNPNFVGSCNWRCRYIFCYLVFSPPFWYVAERKIWQPWSSSRELFFEKFSMENYNFPTFIGLLKHKKVQKSYSTGSAQLLLLNSHLYPRDKCRIFIPNLKSKDKQNADSFWKQRSHRLHINWSASWVTRLGGLWPIGRFSQGSFLYKSIPNFHTNFFHGKSNRF
jgi:hypothetical protein